MRFTPDGPNIPDELLEASDHGDVIFLCGAGISRPAGLPGFAELAQQVVEKLGAPPDAPSRLALRRILGEPSSFLSLDQVFQNLKYEYGPEVVDEVVSALLDPPSDASTEQHAILLRLSRNAARRPQIVTTNFDQLFERVDPSLSGTAIVAPVLPDLTQGQSLEGIVYLHGRRQIGGNRSTRRLSPLILSSADFGRAYLAQGWATKFMTDLLRHYTLVLVGYSANDPPVRYLLEGIHSLGEERRARIYAFDRGSMQVVQDRWRDRGVRILAYPESDSEHAALWGTLRAWADRVDDIDRWRRSIAELATRRPSELRPYQRGQVASLVRTDAGAKAFRENNPVPPAEWLCVFDRTVRYGQPIRGSDAGVEFDPLVQYGLDDDPPRPPRSGRETRYAGVDLISTLASESDVERGIRLAGLRLGDLEPITARLFHLAHWVARLLDDPVVAWWAAGYQSLHPRLLFFIEAGLENPETKIHPLAYRTWGLLVERAHQEPHDSFGGSWYSFARLLKRDGWTTRLLREFERIMQPQFTCSRPSFGPSSPPTVTWDQVHFRDVAQFDVTILSRDPETVTVPSDVLPEVFRILRRGLERAADMLADIETTYWQTTTFIPEDASGERYLDEIDKHLLWFVMLFDRLSAEHPEAARDEVKRWRSNEMFFFDKLRLYAWRNERLIPAPEVAEGILKLSDAAFWNFYQRRELLHALRSRWSEFDSSVRERIESRIAAGPARLDEEENPDYDARKGISAARLLGWLQSHGAELSPGTCELLPRLRTRDPRWQPAWDEGADAATGVRTGYVRVDSDPSEIVDAPLADIVARATQHSQNVLTEFVDRDPFLGLVERRPRRALAALSYGARGQNYPLGLWQTLLQRWPTATSVRLRWTLAERLMRLPTPAIVENKHAASDWFEKYLPELSAQSLDRALRLWDRLLEHFRVGGEAAAESGVGETYIGAEPQHRSRRTHEHAINSPMGRLTQTLLKMLGELHPTAGAGLPESIRSRLSAQLATPGPARDYSLSVMALDLGWLHFVDPQWARVHLLPLFDPAGVDAEPAWSGYTYDQNRASPELFERLKPHFLAVFPWLSRWRWDDGALRHFIELLVVYCYWHQNGGRYVTYSEVRAILQQTTDMARAHAVWTLTRVVKDQRVWPTFGKAFLENAWPREQRFQTDATSRQLAELARGAGDEFPDAVTAVVPLLVPIEHIDVLLHDATEASAGAAGGAKQPQKFPEPFLGLLDRLIDREARSPPHGLGAVVNAIAEAAPPLRQDPRWRRLSEMANRG